VYVYEACRVRAGAAGPGAEAEVRRDLISDEHDSRAQRRASMIGFLFAVSAIGTSCTAGTGPFETGVAPDNFTTWERTNALMDESRVNTYAHGSLDWTLTAVKGVDGKVCWTAEIESGPQVLSSISDLGNFCTFELDRSAPVVQFPFVQAAQTMFAEADGQQIIAGVSDDRLTQGRFAASDGREIGVRVDRDGTFQVQLPLDFDVSAVHFVGDEIMVDCKGGALEDLNSGQCAMTLK